MFGVKQTRNSGRNACLSRVHTANKCRLVAIHDLGVTFICNGPEVKIRSSVLRAYPAASSSVLKHGHNNPDDLKAAFYSKMPRYLSVLFSSGCCARETASSYGLQALDTPGGLSVQQQNPSANEHSSPSKLFAKETPETAEMLSLKRRNAQGPTKKRNCSAFDCCYRRNVFRAVSL